MKKLWSLFLMRQLSLINATFVPVFPVPVFRFWSNRITQIKRPHYAIRVIYPQVGNQWRRWCHRSFFHSFAFASCEYHTEAIFQREIHIAISCISTFHHLFQFSITVLSDTLVLPIFNSHDRSFKDSNRWRHWSHVTYLIPCASLTLTFEEKKTHGRGFNTI